MSANVSNDRVFDAIQSESDAWDALVAEVGAQHMEEPGVVGDWTFKDVAAHINAWRMRALDRLEAAAQGKPDPVPPVDPDSETEDEMNAAFYAANRDRPVHDVLSESRATFARLKGVVTKFSADDLSDPNRFEWMDGEALGPAIVGGSYFGHLHEEHEPEIRAWLAGRS